MADAEPETADGSSISVDKVVNAEVLTPPGYERLIKYYDRRILRLTSEEPIKLILGRNHEFKLRREDDGTVKISMDGFKLPDPGNEDDTPVDELELPAGVNIERTRNTRNSGQIEIEVEKDEDGDKIYSIGLPDSIVNLQGEQINFTDINRVPDSGLSILIGDLSTTDNIAIVNWDTNLGVAVPLQQPESIGQNQSETEPDSWNGEMAWMLRNPAARTAYENFMNQPGATKEVAMIIAVAVYLYGDQLKTMGKEGFISMVRGIRAALPKPL